MAEKEVVVQVAEDEDGETEAHPTPRQLLDPRRLLAVASGRRTSGGERAEA